MNPIARNDWIDLLRAVSALAVVLFHFNRMPVMVPPDWLARTWHAVWIHGHWGVGVFFALSGYCLIPGWIRSPGSRDFFQRRVVRIFPSYWCSLLLVATLAVATKLLTGVNDVAPLPRDISAITATVLLVTNPVTTIPTINWVYWTLSNVLAFYALIGLVLLWPRPGRIPALAGLHALLCLVDFTCHPAPAGPLFFIQAWPIFGLGLAVAIQPLHRRTGWIMLLTSLLHAIWLIGGGADVNHYLAVGGVTLAVLVLCRDRAFPRWLRPLAWIGKISYSLYLVHVPIGVYVLMRYLPRSYTMSFLQVGAHLLLLAATTAAAGLFYLVAERPFLSPRHSTPPA